MTIINIINKLSEILDLLLPFLVAIGVIIFVWGVVVYVISDEEEAKKKGRDRMLWGVIGFVVIAGLYGLVNIVLNTFGLDQNSIPRTIVPATPQVGACGSARDIGYLICRISEILNTIIPLLIAVGVIIFVWGVIQYVINDEEEAKTKGRDRMIYGVIGLVVIASIWGLVNLITNTFNLDTGGAGVANQFLDNTAKIGGSTVGCSLGTNPKLGDVMGYATCLITKSAIPLLFALAILMFVWGVVQYVISGASEEQKEKGRQFMIYGIIGLAVMVSVWGLVRILGDTFGIEYAIPQVKQ